MIHLTLILALMLLQTPSLDSPSPKERLDAVEAMSLPGRSENVPALSAALKKEARGDVRAAIVAGLGRIGGPDVIPVLVESLKSDLDKDVRLQVVDSMQRLYIPVNSQGTIKTVFNKVKSVFAEPDRPLIQNPAVVDPVVNTALADTMHRAWVDFATKGEPGWTRYDLDRRAVMRFDATPSLVDDPYVAERAMWAGLR